MNWKKFLRNYLGAFILLGAMIFAVVRVTYTHLTYEAPDVTTIRICHWQLEAGFRDSLQKLIDEYEQLYYDKHGRKVRVLQVPVSERGYQQYVNTGLIGGMAPDIIEKGFAKAAIDPAYVARFFRPLGQYLSRPNPYNEGTRLEGVPWRETFFDGLQSGYDRTLLDYYYIPFSMFTVRMYYNKELLREATGSAEPPKTFLELQERCEKIREYGRRTGKPVVPIAGSKYQAPRFRQIYERTFLFDLIPKVDENLDGNADVYETWLAYRRGDWRFTSDRFIASWQCMVEIAKNFQDGWLAALRDDSSFMFVQGRAVMIASGSWDAPSIRKEVGDSFEIGFFDFPMPTDDPRFSKYVPGPVSEASTGPAIPWSITRQSEHPELCVDFLQFCTTRKGNEAFNYRITWLPVVLGADIDPILKPFEPRMEGFTGNFQYDISTPVKLIVEGNRWPLYTGQMSPEEFGRRAAEVYEKSGAEGYEENLYKHNRNVRNLERILGALLAQETCGEVEDAERHDQKVQQILQSSQDFSYMGAMRQDEFERATAGGTSP
jgi:raffinose/stachyose/melibiose transport system substrate-binding protein